jgi:hypothetical protein
MSNQLAVAAVTATLRRVIQGAFDTDVPGVPGAVVHHVKPSAPPGELPATGANLILYQVTPNLQGRNHDLTTRAPDGSILQRPRAALDLHYLISFYGDDTKLEPHILLASTVRVLHANPVLERAAIEAMLNDPTFSFLIGADLADAPDLVRLSPSALSLEETSKLWSIFFQTPYVLSVSYIASMVFLDANIQARSAPLPVRLPALVTAQPLKIPRIADVLSRATPGDPAVADQLIFAGYQLVLAGHELQGSTITRARVDDIDVAPVSVSDTQVELALPTTLRAGPHLASVVHQVLLGLPPVAHAGTSSNSVPFLLCPTITASPAGPAVVRVTFAPKIAQHQRVALLLNEVVSPGTTPRAFRFDAPALTVAETDTLDIPVPGTSGATFLVRVEVDGAQSPLHFNAALRRYDLPTVAVA